MAVVGALTVLITGNSAPLMASLAKSEAQLRGFTAANAGAGAGAAASFAPLGAAAGLAGLAVVAGMGMAVRAAADFESQMNTINTIARLDPGPLAAVGKEIRGLAVETGADLPDLTSSFYDLLSVGVPVGNAMEFLGNAVTLSIGGLSTANQAVMAITTAINAWSGATGAAKLTMQDSALVMDVFAQAIAAGGMTAADIPGALANVAAQAAMMNMPLEEVAATWAILTVRGLSASEASTSLAATLTALAKAPPGMEKLQKATGKTYLQISKTQGVHEAVMQLVADAAKYGVVLEDVFGRKEALPFVTFTTGATGHQLWIKALGDEYNSTGVAQAQMEERTKGLNHQLDLLGATVTDLGITLGTALLPGLTDQVSQINDTVKKIEGVIGRAVALYDSLPSWMREPISPPPGLVPKPPAEGVQPGLVDTLGQAIGIIPEGAFPGQPKPWGTFNTPGFHAGEAGSPFQGPQRWTPTPQFDRGRDYGSLFHPERSGVLPGSLQPSTRQPIHLHHTTINQIDGREIARSVETTLYNDWGVFSSGGSSDDRPRQ